MIYTRLDRFDEATENISIATEINPNSNMIWKRVRIYYKQGKYKEALEVYNKYGIESYNIFASNSLVYFYGISEEKIKLKN